MHDDSGFSADDISGRILTSYCPHCGKPIALEQHELADGDVVYGALDTATAHVSVLRLDGSIVCEDRVPRRMRGET